MNKTMIAIFVLLMVTACKTGDQIGARTDKQQASSDSPPMPPTNPGVNTQASPDCAGDSDCLAVPADCCGCNQGGKAKAIPLSTGKAYSSSLSAQCRGMMCVQVISNDPSCSAKAVCDSGNCVLK